jgi:hypothetical protein
MKRIGRAGQFASTPPCAKLVPLNAAAAAAAIMSIFFDSIVLPPRFLVVVRKHKREPRIRQTGPAALLVCGCSTTEESI